jgi:hypothetical protein
MRPKAREMTQHGGPPSEICVVMDGPRRLDGSYTAWPGMEQLSCKLLANPAAVIDGPVLNVHKTPS